MTPFASTKPPRIHPGSPEWRATLFGQAISYAGHLTGEICPYALHKHLRSFVGQSEDRCEGEIGDAVLMLIQLGLFTTNTTGPDAEHVTIEPGTMLTACPMLTSYLYGEPDDIKDEA